MGFWNRWFNKTPAETRINTELVTKRGVSKYVFSGVVGEVDVVRAAIRPFAKAAGKLEGRHLKTDKEGNAQSGEVYMRMLLEEPNALMSGQMLQERLAWHYMLDGDAFALVQRDGRGYAIGIFPLFQLGVDAFYSTDGRLFLRFHLKNSKTLDVPYEDVIHLRRDYMDSDVFGCQDAKVLNRALDVIVASDNSVIKAVENGGILQYLMQYKVSISPEDVKKRVKDFVETYLKSGDNNETIRVAGVSGQAEIKQLEPHDYVPNAAVMDRTVKRIYDFFNTNEAIVQSKYDENAWNAYYEAVIEPFAKQLSVEFTRKLFSRTERSRGNRVVFDGISLQYASMASKLAMFQMVDRRAMTPNEWRRILNLPPLEGGNVPMLRLDTAVVTENSGEGGNGK